MCSSNKIEILGDLYWISTEKNDVFTIIDSVFNGFLTVSQTTAKCIHWPKLVEQKNRWGVIKFLIPPPLHAEMKQKN